MGRVTVTDPVSGVRFTVDEDSPLAVAWGESEPPRRAEPEPPEEDQDGTSTPDTE